MRTKSTINKLILTLLSSFLIFAFSFQLQAQSVDLLDKEAGYKDFKLGQVISDVSAYQLDAKRSTKKLKAYVHKGSDCKEFNGVEIDGIVLYLNEAKELIQIEFFIENMKPVDDVGLYMSIFQNHYGKVWNYDIVKKGGNVSYFTWESEMYELTFKITAIDTSNEYHYFNLFLQKK